MAKITAPLTNTQVKQAKSTAKAYKLSDGGGLYLYVSPTGTKSWRLDYSRPYTKRRATLTLGQYPEISLAGARTIRAEYRSLLAIDIDPADKIKQKTREQRLKQSNTFEIVAAEYIERQDHLSKATLDHKVRYAMYLNNHIGRMPIADIKPIDVLEACRKVEKQGYLETAKKMRSLASQIFRYAVQTARCERDITQDLKGALKPPEIKHYPAITDPEEFAILLRAIDDYDGMFETRIAIKIIPHLFVRSGELRHALWEDFDFEARTWTFTPRKTKRKTGVSLIVPLSDQVYDLFKQLEPHKRSDFVFPSLHSTMRPMSENTLGQALKRLGFSGEQHTVHGFRASARTMLVERLKYDESLVEMQLGHNVRDLHGRAYNRTVFLDERREMMQTWSNYLDELKSSV